MAVDGTLNNPHYDILISARTKACVIFPLLRRDAPGDFAEDVKKHLTTSAPQRLEKLATILMREEKLRARNLGDFGETKPKM
jgi:hypothetical protein